MLETLFGRFRGAAGKTTWPELEGDAGLAGLAPSDKDRLMAARSKIDTSGFHVERADVPGYRKTVLFRSRETLLFCGVADDGKRISFGASMKEPFKNDARDLTAEALQAYDAHQEGREAPGKLFMDLREGDWLFEANTSLTQLEIEKADQVAQMARVSLDAKEDMAFFMLSSARSERALEQSRESILELHEPDVRQLMEEGRLPHGKDALAWISSPGKTVETPRGPQFIEPRKDAARQIAWIAGCLSPEALSPFDYMPDGHAKRTELARRIDEGGSVLDHTADALDVRRSLINRLKNVPAEGISRHSSVFVKTVQKLDRIPNPNQIEPSADGVRSALRVVDAQATYQKVTGHPNAIEASGMDVGRITKSLRGHPPEGLNDMREYIRDRLLVPAFWQLERENGKSPEEASISAAALAKDHIFLQDHTFSQAYKATADWHDRLTGINSRTQELHATQAWQAYRGDVDLGEGVIAKERNSTQGLKADGDDQGHCVGGYTDKVLAGESIIYSLQRGGQVLSTVEIACAGKSNFFVGSEMVVKQNLARGNEKPLPEATPAAERLRDILSASATEDLPAYRKGLKAAGETRAKMNPFERLCTETAGYDISDREKVQGVFGELARFLPKSEAALGFDAWTHKHYARASGASLNRGLQQAVMA